MAIPSRRNGIKGWFNERPIWRSRRPRLVLFFTKGISLKNWEASGMFDREVALYQSLVDDGFEVFFVTYGGRSDLAYEHRLPGIRILCNRWGLSQRRYVLGMPILHGRHLAAAAVIKSNQTNGADAAMRAARFWRKPFVARCGYMWSDLATHGGKGRSGEARLALRVEKSVFKAAHKVIVTTPSMGAYIERNFALPPGNVRVIPNYVLTDVFAPHGTPPVANRLCFVGRLNPEKNPLGVVNACAGLDVELVMVGDGPLRSAVTRLAKQLGVRLKRLDPVPHRQLSAIYGQSAAFILASPHEGHPKTLLEAMSCGLPVIGTDVPGIREIITHGENGFLCQSAPEEIRGAIRTVLGDARLQETMGRNARQFVLNRFSLAHLAKMEADLLRTVAGVPSNGVKMERLSP